MLTRCRSVSVASSLHSIPGATCSHSGSDHCRAGGSTGGLPVSSAIRSARRACSDVVGRSTSVGQETNRSTTGRRLSTSRWQSGHEAMWASDRGHFARRQGLQGVGARQLGLFAMVQCRVIGLDFRGMRVLHTPKTSNASFWIGPEVVGGKRPSAGRRRSRFRGCKYFLRWTYTPMTGAHRWSPYGRIMRPRRFSEGYLWCW